MAKSPSTASASADAEPEVVTAPKAEPAKASAKAPAEPVVGLDEVCTAISQTVRSASLLAGFHRDETNAGRLRDTAAAFRERFAAFRTRPAG